MTPIEETYDEVRDLVESVARNYARAAGFGDDADDFIQEAGLAFLAAYRSYDGRSRFSTWTYRLATQACIKYERRLRRWRPAPSEDVARAVDQNPGASVWEFSADARAVLALVREMPDDLRAAVYGPAGGLRPRRVAGFIRAFAARGIPEPRAVRAVGEIRELLAEA